VGGTAGVTDCMQRKDGASENGCPSCVDIDVVNARELWEGEHGIARELLNVGSLSARRRGTVVHRD
jgi:hypothetical protein